MERALRTLALISILALPEGAGAQSSSAFAGWAGLVSTPVAAFSPSIYIPPPSPARRRWGVEARYSHWQFAPDDDNTTNLGVGASFPMAVGRWGIQVGRTSKKECSDCDAYMFGADLDLPFLGRDGAFTVILHPEVGFSTQSGGSDLTTFGAALDVPLLFPKLAGRNGRVVPFVSPGVGLGRISGGGSSDTGGRFLIGGGVSFLNVANGLQVTASVSRILIQDGATVLGVALGYGR